MALVQCPDCNRQISDLAPACPGCGTPMKAAQASNPKAQAAIPPPRSPKKRMGPMARLTLWLPALWFIAWGCGYLSVTWGVSQSEVTERMAQSGQAAG